MGSKIKLVRLQYKGEIDRSENHSMSVTVIKNSVLGKLKFMTR